MKKKLFILYFGLLLIQLWTVPANPEIIRFIQNDGSELNLFQRGDEFVHWSETSDGYTVLNDGNNMFFYAILDNRGDMGRSDIQAHNHEDRDIIEINFLRTIEKKYHFSEAQVTQFKEVISKHFDNRGRGFPTTGTNNLLMILANFSNTSTSYTQSDFNNYMNQVNYNGTGSFRDFYFECSYGLLTVNTTVSNWVVLPNNHDYYGPQARWGEFAYDSVEAADSSVDYSNFDNDSDGTVDGVAIIHQGPGQEATSNTNDIWSHSWNLSSAGYSSAQRTFDGVLVNAYTTQPETGSGGMATIGVMCHEFGHNLGAPDFYDTDYGTGGQYNGTGYWDTMASGSYNGSPSGSKPAHHNGFTKWYYYSWCSPTLISTSSNITMRNSVDYSTDFYYYTTTTSNEYFFLENRQQTGFDSGLPGHGLIIYHVDQDYIDIHDGPNDINASSHQGLYPKAANGTINNASCPFPGTSSNTSFTDTTTPDSKSWANANTNKPITDIQEIASVITFAFMGGPSQIPDITVNQTTFSETLDVNTTGPQTLSISNNGEAGSTLDYEALILTPGGRSFTPPEKYPKFIYSDPPEAVPANIELGTFNRVATTLYYHNSPAHAIGTSGTATWICAIRFTSAELSAYYADYEIQKIRIYINGSVFTECVIKVWEGGSYGDPGSEIYSQDVTGIIGSGWNEHSLSSPVSLISGNEYWVGYSITATAGYPSTTDDGELVSGKGAWIKWGSGAWQELPGFNAPWIWNWLINMEIDETLPKLTVTSPNGPENWAIGSAKDITWTHSGLPLANVKLEMSINNGFSYSEITPSTPNDGTHEWTITGDASEDCLIRISDPATPSTNDVSNAPFRIYNTVPWLTMDQDSGSLAQGGTDNITLTFNSTGLSEGIYNANIEIISNDPDEGTVIIPVTLDVRDDPLPVILSSFIAEYEDNYPSILWTTQSETNNLGWNIYCSPSQNIGQGNQLNTELIPGAGTTTNPTFYKFDDTYSTFYPGNTYWYFLESVDLSGETSSYGSTFIEIPTDGEEPNLPEIPIEYGLLNNHPNPFNPDTIISFNLKNDEFVRLKIYNSNGNLVRHLIEGQYQAGLHKYIWDGKDVSGKQMSSGIYIYYLEAGEYSSSKKMMILK
jgi:M6 family metalloprotease-like protein